MRASRAERRRLARESAAFNARSSKFRRALPEQVEAQAAVARERASTDGEDAGMRAQSGGVGPGRAPAGRLSVLAMAALALCSLALLALPLMRHLAAAMAPSAAGDVEEL